MRVSKLLLRAGVAYLSLVAGSIMVLAQGVMERPRPDYDPVGIPAGAFRIYPNLYGGIIFDDNVYRTQTNTQSDTIFELAPEILISSNWSQHALNLRGSLQTLDYDKLDSETRTNWSLGADGRLDILRGVDLSGATSYSITHEPRTSPDQPGFAANPTRYALTHAEATFRYRPARLGFQTGVIFDRYDFDNTLLVGGGILNNQDRNRDQFQGFVRGDYEFSPGYTAFLRGTFDNRSFEVKRDRTGVDRDSNGERIDAGVELLVTRLIRGQVFAGYLHQNYKAPLPDVSGFNYGAALDWFPTELITVHLNASRTLTDTTILGASTRDDRQIAASFDYELLRNLIIQGGASYTDSVFQGSVRDDEYVDANLAATYLISRYLSASARYTYSNRSSSVPGQDFNDNLISGGVRLRL